MEKALPDWREAGDFEPELVVGNLLPDVEIGLDRHTHRVVFDVEAGGVSVQLRVQVAKQGVNAFEGGEPCPSRGSGVGGHADAVADLEADAERRRTEATDANVVVVARDTAGRPQLLGPDQTRARTECPWIAAVIW